MGITGTPTRSSRRLARRCGALRAPGIPQRVQWAALHCAAAAALVSSPADAQATRVETSIAVEETLTNNVNLDPAATRRSDFISQITPAIRFNEAGAHSKLTGQISLPILLYARTG